MSSEDNRDEKRYQALKSALADIGYIRRGSLTRHFTRCGKLGCRCQATPPKLHGPYYDWTRKVSGKTVTQRLTPEEAEAFREWNRNTRRFDSILVQMQRVSLRLTDRVLRQLAKPPRRTRSNGVPL